jgi:hypothetical protein
MSSPSLNTDEVLALALSGTENMISAREEREQSRPHTFLSLAPTTSSSYPVKPATKSPVTESPVLKASTETAVPEVGVVTMGMEKTRRSSSLSSNGSLSQKRRFLKLGPVHHGVHEGEGGDWSEEVAIE